VALEVDRELQDHAYPRVLLALQPPSEHRDQHGADDRPCRLRRGLADLPGDVLERVRHERRSHVLGRVRQRRTRVEADLLVVVAGDLLHHGDRFVEVVREHREPRDADPAHVG